MEPLYKVGDKVRIVERVHPYSDYRCGFIDSMSELAGKIFTVGSVEGSGNIVFNVPDDGHIYKLKGGACEPYMWSSSMLESANVDNTYNSSCIHLSKNNKVKLNFKL